MLTLHRCSWFLSSLLTAKQTCVTLPDVPAGDSIPPVLASLTGSQTDYNEASDLSTPPQLNNVPMNQLCPDSLPAVNAMQIR